MDEDKSGDDGDGVKNFLSPTAYVKPCLLEGPALPDLSELNENVCVYDSVYRTCICSNICVLVSFLQLTLTPRGTPRNDVIHKINDDSSSADPIIPK